MAGTGPVGVAAFNHRFAKRTIRAFATLAQAAKATLGRQNLYGILLRCLFELAGNHVAGSGHLAISDLMQEPVIDGVLSPYACGPDSCNFTLPLVPHGVIDSAGLHGKLHMIEDDSRFFCWPGGTSCNGDGIVPLDVVDEMVSKARTTRLTAAMHGLGAYFYNIPGDGWFGRPSRSGLPRSGSTPWDHAYDMPPTLFCPLSSSSSLRYTSCARSFPHRLPSGFVVRSVLRDRCFALLGGAFTRCRHVHFFFPNLLIPPILFIYF